jgi:hypothetical protein
MTPQDLILALKKLDSLYVQKDSFRSWLSGNAEASNEYEQVREQIEAAYPGLSVVYVDITFCMTHGLVTRQ